MNAIDLAATLAALQRRFRPGAVTRKTTYYLSLGEAPGEKWTVTVDPASCQVTPGKIASADCVLKMSAPLFVSLVEGRFKPGAMDLLSGKIKTNDIDLLQKLQQSFGLGVD
jgi:putative sterol carrier protein